MSPAEAVDSLKWLAKCYELAADRSPRLQDSMAQQHAILLGAADCIVQLQDRLVRQACYFEHIEAEHEPRQQWPLLEDDDPGLGL